MRLMHRTSEDFDLPVKAPVFEVDFASGRNYTSYEDIWKTVPNQTVICLTTDAIRACYRAGLMEELTWWGIAACGDRKGEVISFAREGITAECFVMYFL